MQISLRRLLGFMTLGCVGLGAMITFAPENLNPPSLIRSLLIVILVVESVAAAYAACDPWLGFPARLAASRSTISEAGVRTGVIAQVLIILSGVLFLLIGGLVAILIVEDNWSLDSGGASPVEWLLGSTLIATTAIGSFARGASLCAFLALLCGTPLGGRVATLFGLCGGSFVALLLWRPADHFGGNLASGVVGLVALFTGLWLARRCVGPDFSFGRRARRRSARMFLLGIAIGGAVAMIPAVDWLLFGMAPVTPLLGATLGSSLGGIAGLLAGADGPPSPFADRDDALETHDDS